MSFYKKKMKCKSQEKNKKLKQFKHYTGLISTHNISNFFLSYQIYGPFAVVVTKTNTARRV